MARRFEVERFRLPSFEHPERGERLAAYLLDRRRKDRGQQRSNRGGWQSSSDVVQAPEVALVTAELLSLARKISGYTELTIDTAWANINDRGDWVKPHHHKPFCRTVVLMVKPVVQLFGGGHQDDGALLVQDYLGRVLPLEPRPQAGEAVMFPGEVLHMVAPHDQSAPRITIAYNLVQTPGEVCTRARP